MLEGSNNLPESSTFPDTNFDHTYCKQWEQKLDVKTENNESKNSKINLVNKPKEKEESDDQDETKDLMSSISKQIKVTGTMSESAIDTIEQVEKLHYKLIEEKESFEKWKENIKIKKLEISEKLRSEQEKLNILKEEKKNIVNKSIFENYHKLEGVQKTLIDMQLRNAGCKQSGKFTKYTLDEKLLCMAIYKLSPIGYCLLQRLFTLPIKKTLLRVLKVINKTRSKSHTPLKLPTLVSGQTHELKEVDQSSADDVNEEDLYVVTGDEPNAFAKFDQYVNNFDAGQETSQLNHLSMPELNTEYQDGNFNVTSNYEQNRNSMPVQFVNNYSQENLTQHVKPPVKRKRSKKQNVNLNINDNNESNTYSSFDHFGNVNPGQVIQQIKPRVRRKYTKKQNNVNINDNNDSNRFSNFDQFGNMNATDEGHSIQQTTSPVKRKRSRNNNKTNLNNTDNNETTEFSRFDAFGNIIPETKPPNKRTYNKNLNDSKTNRNSTLKSKLRNDSTYNQFISKIDEKHLILKPRSLIKSNQNRRNNKDESNLKKLAKSVSITKEGHVIPRAVPRGKSKKFQVDSNLYFTKAPAKEDVPDDNKMQKYSVLDQFMNTLDAGTTTPDVNNFVSKVFNNGVASTSSLPDQKSSVSVVEATDVKTAKRQNRQSKFPLKNLEKELKMYPSANKKRDQVVVNELNLDVAKDNQNISSPLVDFVNTFSI